MNNSTIVAILFSALMISLAIIYSGSRGGGSDAIENNVSVFNGKQIIDLRAKGGFQPRISKAKAGLPTILRVSTNGTFDCSASIRIPTLGIGKILPPSGSTDIDIGSPKTGLLEGSCGMGMYPFELQFN